MSPQELAAELQSAQGRSESEERVTDKLRRDIRHMEGEIQQERLQHTSIQARLKSKTAQVSFMHQQYLSPYLDAVQNQNLQRRVVRLEAEAADIAEKRTTAEAALQQALEEERFLKEQEADVRTRIRREREAQPAALPSPARRLTVDTPISITVDLDVSPSSITPLASRQAGSVSRHGMQFSSHSRDVVSILRAEAAGPSRPPATSRKATKADDTHHLHRHHNERVDLATSQEADVFEDWTAL